ncbi:hypothetical protein MUN88_21570 [Gracilibacillus caseinilyticus]|uniref:Uncharacterized protein n=1 Tax=Gracilibacillus caseinilyticus TaxID=2932256 RepID=A0ABY4EXJ4_9BACI|nr:hypothetical protein [Gracilibacillus caseinilyticus]UOQ48582.1 hypothetical protein MUN88_21570 [Gracilibacillus caseinilyticus]
MRRRWLNYVAGIAVTYLISKLFGDGDSKEYLLIIGLTIGFLLGIKIFTEGFLIEKLIISFAPLILCILALGMSELVSFKLLGGIISGFLFVAIDKIETSDEINIKETERVEN